MIYDCNKSIFGMDFCLMGDCIRYLFLKRLIFNYKIKWIIINKKHANPKVKFI